MVDPGSVNAIEQIDNSIFVHINGRVLRADGFPRELIDFLNKGEERKPDFWSGR